MQYSLEPEDLWLDAADDAGCGPAPVRFLVQPETQTAPAFWLQADTLNLRCTPQGARLHRLHDVTARMAGRQAVWSLHSALSQKLDTPLNELQLGIRILAEELAGTEAGEFAQILYDGSKRLHEATQDVLEFVHAPTRAREGEGFSLADLPALIARIGGRLGMRPPDVSVAEELRDTRITLSSQAIERVLGELLENSRKFHGRQDPDLHVAVRRSAAGNLVLQLQDNDRTLSVDQLARAWTPYYRAEKEWTGEVPGMGLGLSLVAVLVAEVGGTCRMRNRQDGPGVVVELVLPISRRGTPRSLEGSPEASALVAR